LFLDENNSQELVESILQRHHELAIVARLPYPDKIETIPFATDEIVLIVSPQSKLAKKETVSWSEAAEDPLVCTGAGSSTQSCIWKEFEKRNMQPVSIIEAGSTEFIIRLVKQGKGHAFLPSTCVKEDIARGELLAVPLNEGNFLFYIDVIYLKGKTLSPAASKFVRFLREIKESPKIERAIGTSFHSLYYD
jgi:DNA-binding transcriptional LysR family regulator